MINTKIKGMLLLLLLFNLSSYVSYVPVFQTWPFSFQGKGESASMSPLDGARSDKDTSSQSDDHHMDDLVVGSP